MNVETLTTAFSCDHLGPRLEQLRVLAERSCRPLPAPYPQFKLFLSVSDGNSRAKVVCAKAETFEEAWSALVKSFSTIVLEHRLTGRWIRMDWVTAVERVSLEQLNSELSKTKRNYFRLGLAFDQDLQFALTEQELNSNAALYGGNQINHAVLNRSNLLKYIKYRFKIFPKNILDDASEFFVFNVSSLFCDEDEEAIPLEEHGLATGRRTISRLSEPDIYKLVQDCSSYLARQVKPSGVFTYGMHPCFDREIPTYNALRHASTTYSMIEAWEVTGDPSLKDAIDRALAFMCKVLIKQTRLENGKSVAVLVEENNEIKLGGNAVALLALVKYMTATGSYQHRTLAEKLARSIEYMQDPETGSFVHVLHYPSMEVKDVHRVIYYDGEATFALMRLYAVTLDPKLLSIVENAFQYFISKDHWKHHDHWLAYCVNELVRHKSDKHYLKFAVDNIDGYLNFVENRVTTFPTLLELMMATQQTLQLMADHGTHFDLLDRIDLLHFEQALEKRALKLLNGHFWPEFAMYFQNPNRVVGSCFIRHHAFRVRIDDVEHYLSGFVAYLKYQKLKKKFKEVISTQQLRFQSKSIMNDKDQEPEGWNIWNRNTVETATGGRWLRPPAVNWSASGICTQLPAFKNNSILVVNSVADNVGMPAEKIEKASGAIAILTSDPQIAHKTTLPVLLVNDNQQAILGMVRHARSELNAKVIGITGSAENTSTIAMLGEALSKKQKVYSTKYNAEHPINVASNLCSTPTDAPYLILELPVGQMDFSAGTTKPDLAIFTNELPSNLGSKKSLADIAIDKNAIFRGIERNSTVVFNSAIIEWELDERAARERGLKIITYGTRPDSHYRLTAYDASSNRVYASVNGEEITYLIKASGQQMALNSLAVLAAIDALGEPRDIALSSFATFQAAPV